MLELLQCIRRILALGLANRSEDFIREECLAPVFDALGYDNTSPFPILRGVRLAAPGLSGTVSSRRVNDRPDYILAVCGKPVWIVEAKSTRVPLEARANVSQLNNYLHDSQLGCSHGLLTNGREWVAFEADDQSGAKRLWRANLSEIAARGQALAEFFGALSPSGSYVRGMDRQQIISLYRNGNWLTRKACMDEFIRASQGDEEEYRLLLPAWHRSDSVRDRALPALCLLKSPIVARRVFDITMNDKHDAVRDTLFTVIRSFAVSDADFTLIFQLDAVLPEGWFSRVVYAQMLASLRARDNRLTRRQANTVMQQVRELRKDTDPQVKFFARLAERGFRTPFPFTSFVRSFQLGLPVEIQQHMMTATVRQLADFSYAAESRQSALDAIDAAIQYELPSLELAQEWCDKKCRAVLARVQSGSELLSL